MTRDCTRFLAVLLLPAVCFAAATGCVNSTGDITGSYRAVLESPGGDLAFPLHVQPKGGDSLDAYVINGADTTRFSSVRVSGDSVIFSFDYYDSHIRAGITAEGKLIGQWDRRSSGERKRMPFRATRGISYRYPSTDPDTSHFAGNWQITFHEDDGTDKPGYGMLVSGPAGRLHGTIRTETGDYRFLEGVHTDSTMILSTFDGAHAYLTRARWSADGTLTGTFWYYNTSQTDWTAVRGENELRDPTQIAAEEAVGRPLEFSFPNMGGDTVSAASARFDNRPMLVYLFGSWCPNCADEARMMRDLYEERYRKTDLAVVGLAYEYTGNFQQDANMVQEYKKRFDIPWTLLIAGTSDKDAAAGTLPFLDEVISFPTTVFVDRSHTIKAIHVGFNGPATGSAYFMEKQSFIQYLNEITQR